MQGTLPCSVCSKKNPSFRCRACGDGIPVLLCKECCQERHKHDAFALHCWEESELVDEHATQEQGFRYWVLRKFAEPDRVVLRCAPHQRKEPCCQVRTSSVTSFDIRLAK
jgi:hypothetical protein